MKKLAIIALTVIAVWCSTAAESKAGVSIGIGVGLPIGFYPPYPAYYPYAYYPYPVYRPVYLGACYQPYYWYHGRRIYYRRQYWR